MTNKKEEIHISLLNVTSRDSSQAQRFRLCQWEMGNTDGQFFTAQFSQLSDQLSTEMETCEYGGIMFQETLVTGLTTFGPLCDYKSLTGLKSNIFTSRTASVSLVSYSYSLETLWAFFENLKVRISLSECPGLVITCDGNEITQTAEYQLNYFTSSIVEVTIYA